jgi:hypothetical protein
MIPATSQAGLGPIQGFPRTGSTSVQRVGQPDPAGFKALSSARRPTADERFQGSLLVEGISRTMEFIDGNKLIELLTTDLLAMTAPRIFIEWRDRGVDMARETSIREFGGMLTNVFMVGWLGSFAAKLASNQLPVLNPEGIYAAAHINQDALEHYKGLFHETLKTAGEGKTGLQVRDQLVKKFLTGLSASDWESIRATQGGEALAAKQEALEAMSSAFQLHDNPDLGCYRLDETLAARGIHPHSPEYKAARLKYSDRYASRVDSWLRSTVEKAQEAQLNNQIRLPGAGGRAGGGRALDVTLKEFRTFLEQFVDRSLHEQGAMNQTLSREAVEGLTRRSEALVNHSGNLKLFTTMVPIGITIVAGWAITIFNAWLTAKKHGGKNYFPGEAEEHALNLADDTLEAANNIVPFNRATGSDTAVAGLAPSAATMPVAQVGIMAPTSPLSRSLSPVTQLVKVPLPTVTPTTPPAVPPASPFGALTSSTTAASAMPNPNAFYYRPTSPWPLSTTVGQTAAFAPALEGYA